MQTTSTTESGMTVVFAPDIGRLMTNIRAVLGLEPLSASDDTLAGFLASMVVKYDSEALLDIFSPQRTGEETSDFDRRDLQEKD